MGTYEDLVKANKEIKTTDIKGKNYAEVNQRVKAFRMVYPEGFIKTELVSNENGVCVFKASVGNEERILATGTAYEKESSSFINKTSYIENCETSAVGRALGMAGFGIDVSIASAEEVTNAINNQEKGKKKSESVVESAYPTRDKMLSLAKKKYPEGSPALDQILSMWKIDSLDDASEEELMVIWGKYGDKNE